MRRPASSTRAEQRQRRRRAHHEAGHVVSALVQSVPSLRYVTLSPRSRWRVAGGATTRPGASTRVSHPRRMDLEQVLEMITHFLAGPAAQRRFSRRDSAEGADGDLRRARYYAGLIGGDSLEKREWLLQVGKLRAQELVRGHWQAIRAVAAALERRGRLLRAEAARIVKRNSRSTRSV